MTEERDGLVARIIEACARNRLIVVLAVAFTTLAAIWAIHRVKLDAIPDLSDPQVIVFTEWMGRSPTLVEDQVTYPIVTALVSAPKVEDVRGYSMFGMSFIYVVFEEGTDVYWARSRVLEYLNGLRDRLPEGTSPVIGPDATGIGWVFQYALVDESGRLSLAELRTFQDFTLRYALGSVPGVAEVASIGGHERQYQVAVDPQRLRAYGITLEDVGRAIRSSNDDVGGRVLEMAGREYFVRGRGYLSSISDLEKVAVRAVGPGGTPILLGDVATVRFGPDIRRGLLEWNGEGEAAGGIVVMRYGENALEVIERVKAKIEALRPTFPEGVELHVAYDRSGLIERSIDTLRRTLIEEAIVVAAVIILFLLHVRSSLLPILSLPISVSLAFIPMYLLDIPSTIMSLGGIAIAVGATVDAEIVMIEASHKKLENAPPGADRSRLLAEAAKEVSPAIFFSLLIIAVSFLPIFTLNGQAGRMFLPLAYTKTFVMLGAAVLSITFAPALRDYFIRGRIRAEKDHPVSRAIIRVYKPFVYVALRKPKSTIAIGALAMISAIPVAMRLGHEFMPPLDEGDVLYMPVTLPNISIEEAKRQLQRQDRALRAFPEVATVFGKIGRAETPTDPAPITMVETTIQLRPPSTWRTITEHRWHTGHAPEWFAPALRYFWPEERRITREELTAEMDAAMAFPGWTNAWTMPIKTRIDMLSTGIRTPVGVKILGADLRAIEDAGRTLERLLAPIDGTRSVIYERSLGGLYLDVVPKRDQLARYGLTFGDVAMVIEAGIGGAPISTTVEGRNRFSINLRYLQDFRADPERLAEVLVPFGDEMSKSFIPLGQVAEIHVVEGPPMVRDESGLLAGYVYVDLDDARRDIGGWVDEAKEVAAAAIASGELKLPPGAYLEWTGQYELLEEMIERMKIVIPLVLMVVILLLYFHFRSLVETAIVLLSVPFALVGSAWLLWLLDYRLSTAVWVGIIALVGLAAQTGIVMIVYIDNAYLRRKRAGKIRDLDDIIWAHMEGTVQRVRPKLMTVATTLLGLLPLLWATGSGADVMKRLAAPMVGGLITSTFLTLEIIPVVYTYWRYEELLWEKLEAIDPVRLGRLRGAAYTLAGGTGAAGVAAASTIYVDWPPGLAAAACLIAGLVAAGGAVAYAIARRGSKF